MPQRALNSPDKTAVVQREIEAGDALFRAGKYREAAERFDTALRFKPNEAEYHYKLACAAWRAEDLDRVERHLQIAQRLAPRHAAIQEALALWFLKRNELGQAAIHSEAALAGEPNSIAFISTRAEIYAADGQDEAAWKLIAPLIAKGTSTAWLARVYAKVAPRVGRENHAAAFLTEMLRIPHMESDDRQRLHFALSALFEKMGRYDDAFAQARLGNQANPRRFDMSVYANSISRRISFYTKKRLKSLPHATHGNRRPVLVVGMPRSGTTLVEQILACHPQVFGAGELSKLSDIIRAAPAAPWAEGKPFPECTEFLSLRGVNEMAAQYLSLIDSLNSTATYVVDKMPMNFVFLGGAELLLPEAKVIHCIRDPRDTCLSCYFTDFGANVDFSTDLANLASVYRDYRRLMDHWKKTLSLPMLEVRYEDVVADQAGQTRRMLEFLGLPWDDQCLSFHQNKRPITTASREQVRRPIYASSVGRWRHYEKHIPELMKLSAEC